MPLRRLRIGIIDIVSRGPTRALYARVMNPNLASIMPQVIGVWCKEDGHDVTFVCYTGLEDLLEELPSKVTALRNPNGGLLWNQSQPPLLPRKVGYGQGGL